MFNLMSETLISKLNRLLCLTFLTGLIFLNSLPSPVWAMAKYTGQFTLTQPCEATTSIRSGKDPVSLSVNQVYEAIALNKAQRATHAYIKVPNVGDRWIALSCGNLNSVTDGTDATPINEQTFLPFFDTIDNIIAVAFGGKQDLTPIPPKVNDFDIAINELCGEVGTVVSPEDFQETLKKFPDVLANIKQKVGGSLVAGRTSDSEFLDDLTDIWFKAHGFDHIFCGEPGGNNIGGLHFAARYLDLQNKNLAGRLPNADNRAEVEPGAIYSLGVVMQVGDRLVKAPFKGYGYTLNAEDILEIAAKAYKDNPNTEATTKACLLTVTDDDKTFANVFVSKNGAIRTFYPDATPDRQKNRECNNV